MALTQRMLHHLHPLFLRKRASDSCRTHAATADSIRTLANIAQEVVPNLSMSPPRHSPSEAGRFEGTP